MITLEKQRTLSEEIVDLLRWNGGLTSQEVADSLERNYSSVRKALSRLDDRDTVINADGRYFIQSGLMRGVIPQPRKVEGALLLVAPRKKLRLTFRWWIALMVAGAIFGYVAGRIAEHYGWYF